MPYLNIEKQTNIEKLVDQVRLDTGLSYPENGLLEIADRLGVEVVSAALPDFKGKKVKGFIRWNDEGEYKAKIYLNANQSDTTKTFTLAHELGHFLLHKDVHNFRIDLDYSVDDQDNQETEANYFAASLLVPQEKLIKALNDARNLKEVASLFGVSIPVIENRLKWLHIGMT